MKNRPKGLKYKKREKLPINKLSKIMASTLLDSYSGATVVTIDAEWSDKHYASYQAYVPSENLRLISINQNLYKDYPNKRTILSELSKDFLEDPSICNRVIFQDLDDNSNDNLNDALLDYYEEKGKQMPTSFLVLLFYSVRDLYCTFGYTTCKNAFLNETRGYRSVSHIYKLKNLKGTIVAGDSYYKIFDLYGLVSISSLKTLASSVGIHMRAKDSLDKYKTFITVALLNRKKNVRQTYLRYSMEDTIVLYEIWSKRINQHNDLLVSAFNFTPNYLFTPSKFPSTIGILVATTFENFVYHKGDSTGLKHRFRAAIFKAGYLNPSNENYALNRDLRLSLYRELERNGDIDDLKHKIEKHCTNKNYHFNALNLASIPFLLSMDKKTSLLTSAQVTGGRCYNERYKETVLRLILDLDLSSCYGNALKDLLFPIGMPTMYAPSVNSKGMSLKDFLSRYEQYLIPGLYKIVITGKLTFEQDLIYSKLLTESKIAFYQNKRELWSSTEEYLDCDHVLLSKEIDNGIITHDILEIIRKVATAKELAELLNLEVRSAIYWSKEHHIPDLKEWTDKVLSSGPDEKKIKCWTHIPLKDYIVPLINARKALKARAKIELDPEKKLELDSMQTCYKLAINTLYGCFASRFFRISNVVIGDNITSRPRGQIWLASKALGGVQTITDGFAYQPLKALYLKVNNKSFCKPGLAALSSYYNLINNRNVGLKPHLNLPWESLFETSFKGFDFNDLDVQTKEAINEFWAPYQLSVTFDIEHKPQNTSHRAAFWSKAHYVYDTINNGRVYKLRGHREYSSKGSARSPLYEYLDHLLDGLDVFPDNLLYDKGELLSLSDWKRAYKKDYNYPHKPGDYITSYGHELKLQPTHMPSSSVKSFKKKKRYLNKKNRHSYHVDYGCDTISDMIKHMLENYGD